VLVAGKWIDGSKVIAFLGASNPVRILPGPVETVKFVKPPEGLSAIVGKGTTYLVSVQVFDKYGNKGTTPTKIRCESMRPEIGDIIEGEIETDSTGSAIFKAVITNGEVGDTFALAATLIENGVTTETALICGEDVGVLSQRYMSDKNSDIQFELFDLQGRRIKRFVAGETFHAETGRRSVYSGTGRGMYLVRMTNVKTGKVNVLRRMKLQR
jgi:hypothetical protein